MVTSPAGANDAPKLLVCDSDALFQLLIANLVAPLRELKRLYGIQPVVTQEVELELRSNKRYGKRVEPSVLKALNKNVLMVLTPHFLKGVVGAAAEVYYPAIQNTGAKYRLIVQAGEAYSHATSVTLKVPTMSNDFDALQKLIKNGHNTASPTIRAFDLLVFAYQAGIIKASDCDNFRQAMLLEKSEYLPKEFRTTSFEKGVPQFCPRLLDREHPTLGSKQQAQYPFQECLMLSRTKVAPSGSGQEPQPIETGQQDEVRPAPETDLKPAQDNKPME